MSRRTAVLRLDDVHANGSAEAVLYRGAADGELPLVRVVKVSGFIRSSAVGLRSIRPILRSGGNRGGAALRLRRAADPDAEETKLWGIG